MDMITSGIRLSAIISANMEAAAKCATIPLEGTQRMFELQAKTCEELWTSSAQQLKEIGSTGADPFQAAVDWSEMFQVNMQRATEINLAYLKNVTDIQTELAHAVAEQLPALSKQLFGSVDELVRATVVTVEDVEPRAAPAHRTRKAA